MNEHIKINAKAGSGKTFRAVQMADCLFESTGKHTLILTFSSILKQSGRESSSEKPYVLVHSFHSSVVDIFGCVCHAGSHMSDFLTLAPKPIMDLSEIELLVIDEIQDLNEETAMYIQHIRKFLSITHKLLIMGDRFQNVFSALRASSPKYLDNPEFYFGGTFKQLELNTSYRLPPKISAWINENINPNTIKHHYPLFWNEHITKSWGNGIQSHENTHKYQEPVDFHRFHFYNDSVPINIIQTVKHYIDLHGSNSVLIIVNSCKFGQNHPAGQIIDKCPEAKWIVLSQDIREDGNVLQNKAIVATTFKVKGCQFRLVIFCGLDSSLEREDPMLSFSLAYTGCSRPMEKLIVLSNSAHDLFFTMRDQKKRRKVSHTPNTINIADLILYNQFDPQLDTIHSTVIRKNPIIEFNSKMFDNEDCYEPVAKYYEDVLHKAVIHSLTNDSEINWISLLQESIDNLAKLYEKRQLGNPNTWADCEMLDQLLESALDLIPIGNEFEALKPIQANFECTVYGFIYLVFDDSVLVHLTCTSEFEYIQGQELLMLGEVYKQNHHTNPKLFVVNPVCGEQRQILPKACLLSGMLKRKRFI
jgi:hypothetical protein